MFLFFWIMSGIAGIGLWTIHTRRSLEVLECLLVILLGPIPLVCLTMVKFSEVVLHFVNKR